MKRGMWAGREGSIPHLPTYLPFLWEPDFMRGLGRLLADRKERRRVTAVGAGVRRTVHRADAFDRSEDIKIESALRGKAALTLEDIVDFKPAGFSLKESKILHPPSLVGNETRCISNIGGG